MLLHEQRSVNLKQLRAVGGVLVNHDPDQLIGRPDNISLDADDRVVRADIVFDDDSESERIWKKVQSGSLRGVSVGYQIESYRYLREKEKWKSPEGREFKGPVYIAERWKPLEFSLTPIPADGSVGVNRSENTTERSEAEMPPKIRKRLEQLGLSPQATDEEAQAFLDSHAEEYARLVSGAGSPTGDAGDRGDTNDGDEVSARRVEQEERHREIRELCELDKRTSHLATDYILADISVEEARKLLIEFRKNLNPPLKGGQRKTVLEHGEEERDKWRRAATDHLFDRCGQLNDSSESRLIERRRAARQVRARTLLDLLYESAYRQGIREAHTWDETALFQRVLAQTESDFPLILADVANKNLQAGFQMAVTTWQLFCSMASVNDFKSRKIYKLGDSGDLELTDDNQPMPEGAVPESKEEHSILTYAKRFGFGRKALINDDLGAFTRIPQMMGNSAARLGNQLFYTLLESASGVGPTMAEDSEALFSASHTSGSNYTATGTALSVASLGVARALFRQQKNFVDSNETARPINVMPRLLLVGTDIETVADQLISSQVDPAMSNATPNPFAGRLQVVSDAYLTDTNAWYLVADPGAFPGCEAAFLRGRREPTTVRMEHTNTLGIEWGIYHDIGFKFFEHRAWYKNNGA